MALITFKSDSKIDFNYLYCLSFNPLLFDHIDDNDAHSEDNMDVPTSRYYLEDSFNNKFCNYSEFFSIFHHNARCLTKYVDIIIQYLN